jgi:predicted dehydrogenase
VKRIGFVGCGNIAPVYVKTLKELGWLEVAAFADGLPDRASAFAAEHGGVALDVDTMLADASIDVVVNLTPASAHAALTKRALVAGKSVFSEKPLASTFADGRELVDLAANKGLRLGCAPDTFLGEGLQAARKVIDAGLIGRPIAALGFFLGAGPERWHPNPEIFYVPGAGPLFDMGPYYFTALANLLGAAIAVTGKASIGVADRVCGSAGRMGDVVRAETATHTTTIVEYREGAVATLITSFDVKATRQRNIEIYGTEATLSVPDPNTFGGPLQIRAACDTEWRELHLPAITLPQQRGIGLADMCAAATVGRAHRASAEQALHVLELMTATLRSSDEARRVTLDTRYSRPSLLDNDAPPNRFDRP